MARTIAIGDIHGCLKALTTLLEAVDPDADDTVVTLGDYIDRGEDSQGVIEELIDLGASCRYFPIMGNHEEMLLQVREGRLDLGYWLNCGGDATLDSYGSDGLLGIASIPPEHFQFIDRCLSFLETDDYFFVHANYDPRKPLKRLDGQTLRWLSIFEHFPGPHQSGKTAVVGHSEIHNGKVLDLGHLLAIDTWCFGGGWLTALDVERRFVWQANNQGELRAHGPYP